MQQSRIKFVDFSRGRIVPAFESRSLLVNRVTPCAGLELEQHRLPPYECAEFVPLQHTLHIQLSATNIALEHKNRRDWQTRSMLQNDICFYPAHQPVAENRWHQTVEIFSLGIDPTQFAKVLGDEVKNQELFPSVKETDLQIQGILMALKADAEQGCPSGSIFAESLLIALSAHLLKFYGGRKIKFNEYRGGLSPHKLKLVTEYLDEHLERDITIEELASLAEMSRFHFVRQFKLATGQTPYQYLLEKRLTLACALVQTTKLTLAEIAARAGFYDQSHFTQHFKRRYKITPAQLKNQ